MPEWRPFGQSRLCWRLRRGPTGELGFHQAMPERGEEGDGAGQGQGPGQARGLFGQAQGGVGA